MHFFQRNRTLFPLFELLVILEPIHRAGSGSSSCLLRDIEFPTDPNARPESSYPLVLIRSTREEISSRGRYPCSNRFRNSAAADSPVASLHPSLLLQLGENEGSGGRKRKRKVERMERGRQPLAKLVYSSPVADRRCSLMATEAIAIP